MYRHETISKHQIYVYRCYWSSSFWKNNCVVQKKFQDEEESGRIYESVQFVCDLHGTVQRSERISINTSTTLLLQQNLYTPFMTWEYDCTQHSLVFIPSSFFPDILFVYLKRQTVIASPVQRCVSTKVSKCRQRWRLSAGDIQQLAQPGGVTAGWGQVDGRPTLGVPQQNGGFLLQQTLDALLLAKQQLDREGGQGQSVHKQLET